MNQPSSTVIELLSIISGIERKHELVAELTGENFNIFRILGLETRENKHSAFLCELLDPKGSHGMKATFLKSFVDKIVSLVAGRFDLPAPAWDDASVKPEKHIGSVSEDYLIGGRLDIEIIPAQEGRRIFIENKIGAGDQQCQLVRYHMHEPAACLLYLTLNGKEASQWSTVHDTAAISLTAGKDYFCVSYKEHLLPWLEQCKEESTDRPLLRETIAQYINLVRHLTHTSISHQMEEEIDRTVLDNFDRFQAAKRISDSYQNIAIKTRAFLKTEILKRFPQTNEDDLHKFADGQFHSGIEASDGPTSYIWIGTNDGSNLSDNQVFTLRKMGFEPSKAKWYWIPCKYETNEEEFFKLCKLDPGKAFDQVVAEHDRYVTRFTEHLEAAATPAQGGNSHVNP